MKLLDLLKPRMGKFTAPSYAYLHPSIRKTEQLVSYYKASPLQINKIHQNSRLKFRLSSKAIVSSLLRNTISPWGEEDWERKDGSF